MESPFSFIQLQKGSQRAPHIVRKRPKKTFRRSCTPQKNAQIRIVDQRTTQARLRFGFDFEQTFGQENPNKNSSRRFPSKNNSSSKNFDPSKTY
jgi:hypothetical protein